MIRQSSRSVWQPKGSPECQSNPLQGHQALVLPGGRGCSCVLWTVGLHSVRWECSNVAAGLVGQINLCRSICVHRSLAKKWNSSQQQPLCLFTDPLLYKVRVGEAHRWHGGQAVPAPLQPPCAGLFLDQCPRFRGVGWCWEIWFESVLGVTGQMPSLTTETAVAVTLMHSAHWSS